MTASSIQVTQGSGTRLATNAYTEGAVTVHDEKMILGEQYLPCYTVRAAGFSAATADSHLLQLMAGSSLNVYVSRIRVYQVGLATTAALVNVDLVRLSTAGTGGTGLSTVALDTTDAGGGATGMALPTAKGTEGNIVDSQAGYFVQTASASLGVSQSSLLWDFDFERLRGKALRIPAGTANGIAVKNRLAVAGATVIVMAEFREASF